MASLLGFELLGFNSIYEVLYVLAPRCLLTSVDNTTGIKQETERPLGARLGLFRLAFLRLRYNRPGQVIIGYVTLSKVGLG